MNPPNPFTPSDTRKPRLENGKGPAQGDTATDWESQSKRGSAARDSTPPQSSYHRSGYWARHLQNSLHTAPSMFRACHRRPQALCPRGPFPGSSICCSSSCLCTPAFQALSCLSAFATGASITWDVPPPCWRPHLTSGIQEPCPSLERQTPPPSLPPIILSQCEPQLGT